ncbi:MAG: hypothetical protein WCG74_13825 [Sediminibacterium sp.]
MLNLKQWLSFVTFMVLFGCKPLLVSYKTIPPQIPIKDSTRSVLLIETGNVHTLGLAITKKREQVVTDVAKNYLPLLQEQLGQRVPIKAVIGDSLTLETYEHLLNHDENTIARLLRQYNASIIILLKQFNAGFSQDRIEKTKTSSGGTEKIAYYSVFFESGASIYQSNEWFDKVIEVHRPHSSRAIMSGLLARGPGYEANKQDISDMMKENVTRLCELFLSTRETVYTKQ